MRTRRQAVADIQQAVSLIVRSVRQPTLGRFVSGRVGVKLAGPYPAVLPYIKRAQPVRVSDLAQMLQVEIPTVSRQLKILDEKGFVSRVRDPEDGRATLVSLTPKGTAMFDTMFDSWLTTIDEIVGEWSDRDVDLFGRQLLQFADLVTQFVEIVQRIESTDGDMTVSVANVLAQAREGKARRPSAR